MEGVIGTIVGGVIVGIVIGFLARLVLPGKQTISLIMTIVIGLAGALAGGFLAELFGVRETAGIDWIKLVFQVGFAALGVVGYERFLSARSSEPTPEAGRSSSGEHRAMVTAGLIALDVPAGWMVDEHEDGAGADLIDGDLHIGVTLMPASLFEAVLVEVPVPTRVEDLREMLGSLLSPIPPATLSQATVFELEGIDGVSVAARGADTSSAVFAYEAVPGVVAIATAWGPTGTFDGDAARSVVSWIRVTGSASEVTAAINAPPPPDFPTI